MEGFELYIIISVLICLICFGALVFGGSEERERKKLYKDSIEFNEREEKIIGRQERLIKALQDKGEFEMVKIQMYAPRGKNGYYCEWVVEYGQEAKEGRWMQQEKNGGWVEYRP